MRPVQKIGHALRVMVVDDNHDICATLAILLRYYGHEVAVFHSGKELLKALPAFGPNAVILDIGMPEMNGYELARRIREKPECQTIFLIAVSAWGQEEDRQTAFEAGINEHLVKPADTDLLFDLLDRL